ncbi:MAG TPA: AraC family transcriptional regulator [Blastocatellia bacterium]|nr:AraC family transcriptional regulator [Blastocatellia bacterium]
MSKPKTSSVTKEADFEMALPDGATLRSHRITTTDGDRVVRVEEDVEVRGCSSETWVSGPSWMFELITIKEGGIYFISGGERIVPPKRFGLLFSLFSITEMCFDNASFHWSGFGGKTSFPEAWMNRPFIFDAKDFECPRDAQELAETLRSVSEARFIERFPRPSELSARAKSIIDQTYNEGVQIAAIAQKLGVSHAHLSRQFKKDFGLAPNKYCHQVRASDAMTRLALGEPIIEVSMDVGYNDLGRFYKQFRKQTNSSPGLCQSILLGDADDED